MLRMVGITQGDITSIVATGFKGKDTLITLDSGTEILIENVKVANITIDDFDFV